MTGTSNLCTTGGMGAGAFTTGGGILSITVFSGFIGLMISIQKVYPERMRVKLLIKSSSPNERVL